MGDWENRVFDRNKHAVLEINLTPLGIAHYSRTWALKKRVYWDAEEWYMWDFYADLPLQATDQRGNELVRSNFLDI